MDTTPQEAAFQMHANSEWITELVNVCRRIVFINGGGDKKASTQLTILAESILEQLASPDFSPFAPVAPEEGGENSGKTLHTHTAFEVGSEDSVLCVSGLKFHGDTVFQIGNTVSQTIKLSEIIFRYPDEMNAVLSDYEKNGFPGEFKLSEFLVFRILSFASITSLAQRVSALESQLLSLGHKAPEQG